MDTREAGFGEALSAAASRAERMLESCLPAPRNGAGGDRGEAELAAAMRHAVLNGGKRLRAFLALEVAGLFGADGPGADPSPAYDFVFQQLLNSLRAPA